MCNCILENRKTSRRCIILWSALSFLSGGAVIYFSIMLMWADVLEKVEKYIKYMDEYSVREYLFYVLFVLAICILCFSCFGMLFKWMRNRCCIIVFGTCLLPLWTATIGIGAGAIYVSIIAADEFENECKDLLLINDDNLPVFIDVVGEGVDNLDINLNIYRNVHTDNYMCSRDCPCEDVSTRTEWEEIESETLVKTYGRSLAF